MSPQSTVHYWPETWEFWSRIRGQRTVLGILLQHDCSSAFIAHPQRVSMATVLQCDTSHSNYQLDHAELSCIWAVSVTNLQCPQAVDWRCNSPGHDQLWYWSQMQTLTKAWWYAMNANCVFVREHSDMISKECYEFPLCIVHDPVNHTILITIILDWGQYLELQRKFEH